MRALHLLPEGRYEGALEMGDALRKGLQGIAPDPTDATLALDSTSATRMLGDTAATRAQTGTSSRPAQRTRRPMEPIAAPQRREAARRASAAPPAAPRRAARPRRNPLRYVFTLVLLLAVAAIGVLGYQLVQDNTDRAVQAAPGCPRQRPGRRRRDQGPDRGQHAVGRRSSSRSGAIRGGPRRPDPSLPRDRPRQLPRRRSAAHRRHGLTEPAAGDGVLQLRHQHLQVGEVVEGRGAAQRWTRGP